MLAFRSHDTAGCVAAYVAERPSFFGIVRRLTWRETFTADVQHTREIVEGSLATYLEETRDTWGPTLDRVLAQAGAVEQVPSPEPDTSEELSPPTGGETPAIVPGEGEPAPSGE